MIEILRQLNDFVRNKAKPNPKLYPDSHIQQHMWNKSMISFYICFINIIMVIVFVVISDLTFPLKLTFLALSSWLLVSFSFLCHSYLWVFHIMYALICLIYGFIGFDMIPEAPYAFTGYIFVNPTSIMMMSGNIRLTLFTGGVYIWVSLTKFREKLLMVIRQEDPEVFVDQYLRFTILLSMMMLGGSIALVSTLDKRSIELLRTKSALENALEQQKTFIFSFSHELRNPINSLLGNLQLVLQGEALSAKAVQMINVAKVCGEILLHNINNVLDIGKHEIGKLEVSPISTQLCELFHCTWSIYGELLRQKKLKSLLKIDRDLPATVRIDPHKINQILLNLIGNSIKFTEKGSVIVAVKWLRYTEMNEKCFEPVPYDDFDEGLFEKEMNLSTISMSKFSGFESSSRGGERRTNRSSLAADDQSRQESKGILKIIVKDTGSGMKKEALEKLFRKFSQVSENVSHRNIGTGLGLFVTKEICLAMGGEIRAYSKFGVGSTFIVCLPVSVVPSENITRANPDAIIHQLSKKHLKAIVADDSPFNVNLICNYFSQFGASVVSVAYNGYDIFLKYKEYRESNTEIDVVTLDIDMPITDGRKACDQIRRYERENRLKPVLIILISGNYDKEQVGEYINPERGHRADCFLTLKDYKFFSMKPKIFLNLTENGNGIFHEIRNDHSSGDLLLSTEKKNLKLKSHTKR